MKKLISFLCVISMFNFASITFAEVGDTEPTSEGGEIEIVNEYGLRMYKDEYAKYEYYPSVDGETVALHYIGNMQKDVIVPAEINGVPVVEVRGRTGSKTGVESITFPDTVQVVEEFFGYTDLKSVTLPKDIKEIPHMAFEDCTALESIEIPEHVEKIGDSAFGGCISLKKVSFNDELYTIGSSAFADCPIEELDFPSALRKIEKQSFLRNKAVKRLTIPQSVSVIENNAFSHTGLESLTFEGRPETIGDHAFLEAPLKEVIGISRDDMITFWNAFYDTPWQKEMIDEKEPFLVDSNGRLIAYVGTATDIEIPNSVKTIGSNAFVGKSVTSLKISESVEEIEKSTFYGCDKLTEITIPASVTTIGQLAFSNCYSLKNITFEYSDKALTLNNGSFQFAPVTKESVNTNNRSITNFYPAFANTVFDPDGDAMIAKQTPKPQKSEKPSAAPEVTAKPTERPKATEKPETTEKPKATTKPISVPKPTAEPEVINVTPGESITVSVGDKEITFMDAQPFIDENGRTKIPIRAVAEGLGCEVEWDDATRTAVIKRGDDVVYITIGKDTLQVGNTTVKMDTAAEIKDDRTYIPVRFVGEALGMQVNWNG